MVGWNRRFLYYLFLIFLLVFAFSAPLLAVDRTMQTFTHKELILNGEFLWDVSSWYVMGVGSGARNDEGRDGGSALTLQNITDREDPRSMAIQMLHLPTDLTSASFSFDYRLVQLAGFAGALELYLFQGHTLEEAIVMDVLFSSSWVHGTTEWISVSNSFNNTQVQNLQKAHDSGEHIWIVFILWQMEPNQFMAILDNVSVLGSGTMIYPQEGLIAFIGKDEKNNPSTIQLIKPDATGRTTIWTHPHENMRTNSIFDVAFRPDGEEIAFSSNHESGYSAFHSDVYGISPDGTGLRRISNPPSKTELEAGVYPMGSVTGRIKNNYGQVILFLVYIQGALAPVSVDIGRYGDVMDFTIHNVADLGDELQYVVFMWSGYSCANGKEYTAAVVDVIASELVDAGTLHFNGICGFYHSTSITWRRDGKELGVDVITPRKFSVKGESIGTDLFNAPLTAKKPVWSPVDEKILYIDTFSSENKGIYLTYVDGDFGERLVHPGFSYSYTPAFLPDGSGFVYTLDNQIRQYLFTGQDTLLSLFYNERLENPSCSPCGDYVVFERISNNYSHSDLWVIQRSKPNQVWPLTNDGKSLNPDWRR